MVIFTAWEQFLTTQSFQIQSKGSQYRIILDSHVRAFSVKLFLVDIFALRKKVICFVVEQTTYCDLIRRPAPIHSQIITKNSFYHQNCSGFVCFPPQSFGIWANAIFKHCPEHFAKSQELHHSSKPEKVIATHKVRIVFSVTDVSIWLFDLHVCSNRPLWFHHRSARRPNCWTVWETFVWAHFMLIKY